MNRSRFTGSLIVAVPKEGEAGVAVAARSSASASSARTPTSAGEQSAVAPASRT
jgi:hypothetical protein